MQVQEADSCRSLDLLKAFFWGGNIFFTLDFNHKSKKIILVNILKTCAIIFFVFY